MDQQDGGGGDGVVVLREIWSELKSVRSTLRQELTETREVLSERIDQTNRRVDETNRRVDETNRTVEELRTEVHDGFSALARRMTESEVRLATATTELSGTVRDLTSVIHAWREEHREDRREILKRVERLEQHVGLT